MHWCDLFLYPFDGSHYEYYYLRLLGHTYYSYYYSMLINPNLWSSPDLSQSLLSHNKKTFFKYFSILVLIWEYFFMYMVWILRCKYIHSLPGAIFFSPCSSLSLCFSSHLAYVIRLQCLNYSVKCFVLQAM